MHVLQDLIARDEIMLHWPLSASWSTSSYFHWNESVDAFGLSHPARGRCHAAAIWSIGHGSWID